MHSMIDYGNMSDNELVQMVASRNDDCAMECLLKRYGNLVRKETRTVFILGAEQDDLIQEGMIGLYKAIKSYNASKEASFKTFATLCVRSQIQSAITAFNRKKHSPLNDYLSIYADSDETGTGVISEIVSKDTMANPEKVVLARENKKDVDVKLFSVLSEFERQVLDLFLDGLSYAEMSEITGKSEKAIDNGLQRIRAKLRKFFYPETH